MEKMKIAEEIRLAIKNNFSELTECTLLNREMCNILLQESLIKRSEYEYLVELEVSNSYKIFVSNLFVLCIIGFNFLAYIFREQDKV